jgi:hypothetical protein
MKDIAQAVVISQEEYMMSPELNTRPMKAHKVKLITINSKTAVRASPEELVAPSQWNL